jgi:hypothetical protein
LGLAYNCRASYFWDSGIGTHAQCKELAETWSNYTKVQVQSSKLIRFANYEEPVLDPNTQSWEWVVKELGNKTYCELDSKCDSEWSWESGVSAHECLDKPSSQDGKYCAECWGDTCADWSQFPRCYTTFQAQVGSSLSDKYAFGGGYSSMTREKCDMAGGTWKEHEWMKTYKLTECWDCCVFENVQAESECMHADIDRLCPLQRYEWMDYYRGVTQTWDYRSFCEDALICYKKDVTTKAECLALRQQSGGGAAARFPKWIGNGSEVASWFGEYTPNDPNSQGVCVVDLVNSWFDV